MIHTHRMIVKDSKMRDAQVRVPKVAKTSMTNMSDAQDRLREAMMLDARRIKQKRAITLKYDQTSGSKGIGDTARRCLAALDTMTEGFTKDQMAEHLGITVKAAGDMLGRLRNRGLAEARRANVNGRSKNLWFRSN